MQVTTLVPDSHLFNCLVEYDKRVTDLLNHRKADLREASCTLCMCRHLPARMPDACNHMRHVVHVLLDSSGAGSAAASHLI